MHCIDDDGIVIADSRGMRIVDGTITAIALRFTADPKLRTALAKKSWEGPVVIAKAITLIHM